MQNYTNILWAELTGFDNSTADCGVGAYLNDLGFIPDAISIFMWGADFVHQHEKGLPAERVFPPDIGCYMDIYYDTPKYTGKPWTSTELKTVIKGLHAHGVKVLFSIFPTSLDSRWHHEFFTEHSEIGYTTIRRINGGKPTSFINPLRHFADGMLYEDFLIGKVLEVLEDYGLDGWHLCDGYNHSIFQVNQADFSDDMLEQFLKESPKVVWPNTLPRAIGADQEAIEERAAFIWNTLRMEWIAFNARRWERFLGKCISTLHGAGYLATANTIWTRDPVESLFRYGIDMRHFATLGFDWLVIETCGCSGEIGDCVFKAHYNTPFFDVILATVLLTRTAAGEHSSPFLFNNCAQDLTEGWSALHYAPGFLEKEIACYSNLAIWTKDGLERCVKGMQVCLAEQIKPYEWAWMKERWDAAFGFSPKGLDGVTLVWCDESVDAELLAFSEERRMHSAAILYHLFAAGVPVMAGVRLENLQSVRGPVLAINPGLWPRKSQEKLMAFKEHPLYAVGNLDGLPKGAFSFSCALDFRLFNAQFDGTPPVLPKQPEDAFSADSIEEPLNFFVEEPFRPVPDEFFTGVAQVIDATAGLEFHTVPGRPDNAGFRFWPFILQDGTWHCIIHNDFKNYIFGEFTVNHDIHAIIIRSNFRGRPMWHDPRQDGQPGAQCFIKIPPKGVGVLDFKWKT